MDENDFRRVERERETSGKRRKGSKAGEQGGKSGAGRTAMSVKKWSKTHTRKGITIRENFELTRKKKRDNGTGS